MTRIEYSVLRYSPSLISGECINLGILYHDLETNDRDFISTQKFERVKQFDDELDIDSLKFLLDSIKLDVKPNLMTNENNFSILSYTKYYIKEFNFIAPITFSDVNPKVAITKIKNIYLRFDCEKGRRPTKEDELSFVKQIMNGRKDIYTRNAKVKGVYDDDIIYDYATSNRGYKFFDLNEKDLKKVIQSVKAWAWNAEKTKQIKTTFVVSEKNVEDENSYLQVIMQILKGSSAEVYEVSDFIHSIGDQEKEHTASIF